MDIIPDEPLEEEESDVESDIESEEEDNLDFMASISKATYLDAEGLNNAVVALQRVYRERDLPLPPPLPPTPAPLPPASPPKQQHNHQEEEEEEEATTSAMEATSFTPPTTSSQSRRSQLLSLTPPSNGGRMEEEEEKREEEDKGSSNCEVAGPRVAEVVGGGVVVDNFDILSQRLPSQSQCVSEEEEEDPATASFHARPFEEIAEDELGEGAGVTATPAKKHVHFAEEIKREPDLSSDSSSSSSGQDSDISLSEEKSKKTEEKQPQETRRRSQRKRRSPPRATFHYAASQPALAMEEGVGVSSPVIGSSKMLKNSRATQKRAHTQPMDDLIFLPNPFAKAHSSTPTTTPRGGGGGVVELEEDGGGVSSTEDDHAQPLVFQPCFVQLDALHLEPVGSSEDEQKSSEDEQGKEKE